MKAAGFWASAVVAGVACGGLWAWAALDAPAVADDIRNGPWLTTDRFGVATGVAEQARLIQIEALAPPAAEIVALTAFTDDAGAPLDGACRYHITGPTPNARWWSITLYDADGRLFDAPLRRHMLDAANAPYRVFDFVTGQDLPAPRGPFSLTLRLFHPALEVVNGLATTTLPSIRAEACG